jgi:hypothetical protein
LQAFSNGLSVISGGWWLVIGCQGLAASRGKPIARQLIAED